MAKKLNFTRGEREWEHFKVAGRDCWKCVYSSAEVVVGYVAKLSTGEPAGWYWDVTKLASRDWYSSRTSQTYYASREEAIAAGEAAR